MSKENLSNEQLVALIQGGVDVQDNLCRLWQQNKAFVTTIAKHFYGCAEFDDLLQEGYLGLCKAVDAYDPDKGSFVHYAAYWIRQGIFLESAGTAEGNIMGYG